MGNNVDVMMKVPTDSMGCQVLQLRQTSSPSTVCGNQNGERGLQSCLPLGKLSKKKKHPVFWALPKWGEGGCSQARLTVQSRKGTENCLDSFSASLIKQVGLGNWLGLALFGKGHSKLHSIGIKDMKNAFLRPLIMS